MGRAASPKGTDKGTDLIADAAGMVGASTVVLLLSGLGVAAQVCMTRAIGSLLTERRAGRVWAGIQRQRRAVCTE